MSAGPHQAEILDALCELGSRYQFPDNLAFIAADEAAFRSPAAPQQALQALVEKFGKAPLIKAGVAVRDGKGLQFISALNSPGSPFVVLRGEGNGRPFGLVTAEGCVGHESPPLLAVLGDRATTPQLRNSEAGNVFVCATVDDMILMRSLGFAAATVAGLTDLKVKGIRAIRGFFDCSVPTREEDASDDGAADGSPAAGATAVDGAQVGSGRIHAETAAAGEASAVAASTGDDYDYNLEELTIVLVAWSLVRLELGVPSCIAAAEEYLRALNENFEMDLKLSTWLPGAADIARMAFVIRSGAAKWLQASMLSSLKNSRYQPLKGKMPQAPVPPANYADAVGRLLGPPNDDKSAIPSPEKPAEAWQAIQQLLERDIVRPIADQAMQTPDHIERTLTAGLAHLSRLFHTEGLLLGKQLSQTVAAKGVHGLAEIPSDRIREVLALAGQMQSMAGEIYRRRESAVAEVTECHVILPKHTPRSLGSR